MKQQVACLCFSLAFACAQYGQNVTVQVGGKTVGARSIINFQSGNGSLQSCMDEPAANRITCTSSSDSAFFATQNSLHNNHNYCVSQGNATLYSCVFPGAPMSAYPTGMVLVLVPGATCSSICSLDANGLGPKTIKLADGVTDPGGTLVAGQPYWLFYDGSVFRAMTVGLAGGPAATGSAGGNTGARDVIARRVISSMETMPYAPSISLEVTAGDLHKTVTSNAIGNATINAATGGLPGQHMWIVIVNDQISGKTITFGANLRSSGPLAGTAGRAATLQFISDGTAWYEVARTTNL